MTKQTREIRCSDYVSPHFSIEKLLIFTIGERESNIVLGIHAEDCLDGDLSGNITVESGGVGSYGHGRCGYGCGYGTYGKYGKYGKHGSSNYTKKKS